MLVAVICVRLNGSHSFPRPEQKGAALGQVPLATPNPLLGSAAPSIFLDAWVTRRLLDSFPPQQWKRASKVVEVFGRRLVLPSLPRSLVLPYPQPKDTIAISLFPNPLLFFSMVARPLWTPPLCVYGRPPPRLSVQTLVTSPANPPQRFYTGSVRVGGTSPFPDSLVPKAPERPSARPDAARWLPGSRSGSQRVLLSAGRFSFPYICSKDLP